MFDHLKLPERQARKWKQMEPGYFISDDGYVVSCKQDDSGKLLKFDTDRGGYSRWKLRGKNHRVHVLVLSFFDRPRCEGEVCRHLNGSRKDNRIENLKWGSISENNADMAKHGTGHNQRVSRRKARQIRGQWIAQRAQARVEFCEQIAEQYKIPYRYVDGLLSRNPYPRNRKKVA